MQSWIPFTSPESDIFESLFTALRPARQTTRHEMTDRNAFPSVSLCLCGERALAERITAQRSLGSLQFATGQIGQETVRRHLGSYVKAVSHFFSTYRKCDLILSLTVASNATRGAGYKAPDCSGFHGAVWPTECIVPGRGKPSCLLPHSVRCSVVDSCY